MAALSPDEAVRAVREHPQLADPDVSTPVVLVLSARDAAEAAELTDLVKVARTALRERHEAAHDVLRALLPTHRLAISPGVLRQVQRNAEAQQALAAEFGLLSGTEVAEAAASRATNASALASRWRKQGAVFSVDVDGSARYPGFQFAPGGRPRRVVADVLTVLGGSLSGWDLALWFTASNDRLGGLRPVDALDGTTSDHEAVVTAARRLADELTD